MTQPLNELERVVLAMQSNPNLGLAVAEQALKAELFYAPQGAPPAGGGLGPIAVAVAEDGTQAAALFSARERVREALGQTANIASLPGIELFRRLRGRAIWLNPNLAYGYIWRPKDVEEVLARAPWILSAAHGASVQFGQKP
ncbi:MAG TPA: hypothetical protein VG983_07715 [Caulobacterales bacterium]|nr:hypothetical protein [Caulobacterales bacterium]